jgi:alpha-D-xyloside xylohydrolase
MWFFLLVSLGLLAGSASASYSLKTRTGALPFFLYLSSGNKTIVVNDGVVGGYSNTSVDLLSTDHTGSITNNDTSGTISSKLMTPSIAKIEVNTSSDYVGARFAIAKDERIFGLWEYPWNGTLLNKDLMFDLKGVGNTDGINWSNARAPFFMSSQGYAVYVDTLAMGSYDFTQPYHCQFIFNASSLVYYIILSEGSATNFKSILTQYMTLSSRIEMPPDSAFGPTFWSDDFETDFHDGVKNAEENIMDVVEKLDEHQIHASAIFDDRPYGTGNSSWGNFDFDPKFYPDPNALIEDLTKSGYDFQVWAANRAFLSTNMFNIGSEKGWLFPGIDPQKFLGPAFDLRIPEAYAWMRQQLENFTSIGVKGFKIDRGEEGEMPVYQQNYQMSRFITLLHNVMEAKWGKGKFYNFARSAVDRSRSHTGIWNGDAHADWQGLQFSVASGIRAGLLGFTMWGSDTGGYNRQPRYTLTENLWARWMWFSAFSPVYEIMIGTGNTPWYPPFSTSSPRLMGILKQTTRLHHELRPYIKSYTYHATQDGVPLLRAMILESPNDTASYELADQYFFGEAFLVAPIVSQSARRSVYFPDQGTKYVEYFNKTQTYSGGKAVNITADINSIPVFVRAGSIIPRGDTYRGNNRWTRNWSSKLELEFFPSFDVPKTVFAYWNGNVEVKITMTTNKSINEVTFDWEGLGIEEVELVMWTKNGAVRGELVPEGGKKSFQNIVTLF